MEIRHDTGRNYGLLYPMMVIAAVAAITFSILGIASLMGWLPSLLQGAPSVRAELSTTVDPTAPPVAPRRAFHCAECSVIESFRDGEQDATPAMDMPAAPPGYERPLS